MVAQNLPAQTAPFVARPVQTQVARLAAGGSVVAWKAGDAAWAQLLDASGQARGLQIAVTPSRFASGLSVAALANGDWVVAWFEQTFEPATQSSTTFTVRFKRFSPDGRVLQEATLGAAPNGAFLESEATAVVGTPDGGFALAWTGKPALGATSIPFLRRYDARGQLVGQEYQKFTPFGTSSPVPLALADGSLVLVWSEATSSQDKSLFMQHFDAAMVPMGQPQEIAASRTSGTLKFGAGVTGEGNVGLAWTSTPIGEPATFTSQIVDAGGAGLTAPVTTMPSFAPSSILIPPIDVALIDVIGVTTRSSGFSVFLQSFVGYPRFTEERLGLVPVAADGTVGAYTLVAKATTASIGIAISGPAALGFGVAAGADDHFVTAYQAATLNSAEVLAEGH